MHILCLDPVSTHFTVCLLSPFDLHILAMWSWRSDLHVHIWSTFYQISLSGPHRILTSLKLSVLPVHYCCSSSLQPSANPSVHTASLSPERMSGSGGVPPTIFSLNNLTCISHLIAHVCCVSTVFSSLEQSGYKLLHHFTRFPCLLVESWACKCSVYLSKK